MPKKLSEDAERIHIILHKRDIERIDKFFANPQRPGIRQMKRSEAIRVILGKFLDQVEAQAQQRATPIPPLKMEDLG